MHLQVDVNGADAHPVYKFLKRNLPKYWGGGDGKGAGEDLVWNFQVCADTALWVVTCL